MGNIPQYLSMFMVIGAMTGLVVFLSSSELENYIEINTFIVHDDNLSRSGAQRLTSKGEDGKKRKNVLFIIVDDLRPQLGAYIEQDDPEYFGKVNIKTPNLDRLALQSIVFKRAYCQQSLCGPSRTSMLTSRRPDMTRSFGNHRYWRENGGNFTTLPQHFKDSGYLTLGISKVFHPRDSSNHDDPPSWSEPYYNPPFSDKHFLPEESGAGWAMVTEEERKAVPLADDSTVKQAKLTLQRISEDAISNERPFFLAVGLRKPHLSLVCPEKYFHWYPLEDDNFMKNSSWESPSVKKGCNVSRMEENDDRNSISPEILRNLRRAYFACISYMDSNVGELISEINRLGLANSTIITFVADHGYHLGENGVWGKMTTNEFATRVPLMIHIPGVTTGSVVTYSLVEAVDLFPTLVEAAGLDPIPPCPTNCSDVALCTQGISLLPLLDDPTLELKDAAYSQVTALDKTTYAIRTKRFRYTERAVSKKVRLPDGKFKYTLQWDSEGQSMQLFDHSNDTMEQYNVADYPDFKQHVRVLRNKLHAFAEKLLEEPKIS